MAAEKVLTLHSCSTSIRAFVNEYRPGSGAMASQLEAEMVSVMLWPVGKVALAAPAQQSRRIRISEMDLSRRVWMADHLLVLVNHRHSQEQRVEEGGAYCSQGDPGRR